MKREMPIYTLRFTSYLNLTFFFNYYYYPSFNSKYKKNKSTRVFGKQSIKKYCKMKHHDHPTIFYTFLFEVHEHF